MNLVRGIGRLLLGGFFIVQGAKAVKDPAQFATAAEPIAQRFVPLAQRTLPPEASAYVPEDPETLVRLNGAASVLGGLGMATGIGSLIAFFAPRANYRFLSVATGFSAGAMLYVSLVGIFVKGSHSLTPRYGDYWGHWIDAAWFFGGMLVMALSLC